MHATTTRTISTRGRSRSPRHSARAAVPSSGEPYKCQRHLADALTCGARVTRLRAALTLDATVSASRPAPRFKHTTRPHAQPIATPALSAGGGAVEERVVRAGTNSPTQGRAARVSHGALKLDATVSASRLAPGFEHTPLGHEQVTACSLDAHRRRAQVSQVCDACEVHYAPRAWFE